MTTISGTVVYNTTVVVTAASGDGATIAAMFNGILIPAVSATQTAVATNASGVVTISWPQSKVRAGNSLVLNTVANILGADTALTSPISISVATLAALTS